ncbi:TPA: sigma-70 domain-containing protein, partial [Shigella boydii]
KENGPEDTTQDDDMKQSIVKWLFELNAKQREVLARRFGLLGYEAATLEDVGREIGLTRERVMNQTRTIRLPIHIVKELNVYLRTARELSHKLDHEPSAEEIAEQLDKPVDDVSRMLRLNERITSVDTPLGGDSEKALLDILAD